MPLANQFKCGANMRRIEAIVFDLGNVLISVHEDRALERICARTGKTLGEIEHYILTTPFVTQLALGQLAPRRFFEIVAGDLGFTGDEAEFAAIWAEVFEPIDEMIQLTRKLKGRLPRYILSNSNAIHIEYVLAHYPFMHELEGWVFSHEVGLMKPDRRIYDWTAQRFGLTPARTVFIDDIPANVEAARAAGWQAIPHCHPAATRAELTKRGVASI